MSAHLLGVRDLLHAPGAQRREVGSVQLEPGGITASRLEEGSDATYDLVLEAHGNQVTATGTVRGRWEGACRRCLEPTGGALEAQVSETFEARPVVGETWGITDGVLDLAPMLREALLLELPVAPLCRGDCVGPDPERYPATREADPAPGGRAASRDPRWAALDALSSAGSVADPDESR